MINLSRIYNFFNANREYSLKINTFFNFLGNIWSALVSLIFVPINLHYLGIEAYGLIGIFNSLQSFVWLFDLGLSGIIARELPQIISLPHKTSEILDLTKTTSRINFLMGILISIFLVGLSPLVAYYWLQNNQLPDSTVSQALMIMSAGFVVQWSLGFYGEGLAGLQKQTLLNLINIIFGTVRSVGGVLVLIFISPTIQAFLLWQIIVGVVQLLTVKLTFRRCLPKEYNESRFDWSSLKTRFGFAAGLTVMSVLALVLHQLDKIILSRLLTLESFGYYSLATTVTTMGLAIIPRSITNAAYPKFSYLVSLKDEDTLRELYHRVTQTMAVLLLHIASILIVFPYKVLFLWTHNEKIAENTWFLLMILATATAFNGFLSVPFYMQLAHGWTRIVINTAIATLFIITPAMILTVNEYGAVAGAMNWLALNLFQILVSVSVMHRYILIGEQLKWYFADILKPFAVALGITYLCSLLLNPDNSKIQILLTLAITVLTTYACLGLVMSFTRNWAFETYKKYFHNRFAG